MTNCEQERKQVGESRELKQLGDSRGLKQVGDGRGLNRWVRVEGYEVIDQVMDVLMRHLIPYSSVCVGGGGGRSQNIPF